MLFWCITILRYVIAAFVAVFVSLLVAFFLISWVIAPHDDSPALGLAWLMFAAIFAALLVPVALGVAAEMVERKVEGRRFGWLKAVLRCILAFPIMLGPLYWAFCVWGRVEDSRPSHWVIKEAFLLCMSVPFVYLALRVKTGLPARLR